jgi:hypothetical protein
MTPDLIVNGCIIKTGVALGHYPHRRVGGKLRKLHRVIYEEAHGPIPEGYRVHHKCEETRCVRLDHLIALPPSDHMLEHRPWRCKNGHVYDEANTHIDKKGHIRCRTCERERQREYARLRGRW